MWITIYILGGIFAFIFYIRTIIITYPLSFIRNVILWPFMLPLILFDYWRLKQRLKKPPKFKKVGNYWTPDRS